MGEKVSLGTSLVVQWLRICLLRKRGLFRDIQSLPRNAALRKLNDLIKRARLAKVRLPPGEGQHGRGRWFGDAVSCKGRGPLPAALSYCLPV